jgi:hypothetical protein
VESHTYDGRQNTACSGFAVKVTEWWGGGGGGYTWTHMDLNVLYRTTHARSATRIDVGACTVLYVM